MEDGKQRYFHGLTASFSKVEDYGKFAHFRATLRPWLWLLSRTADCRIFQQKTVPDVIKLIFQELGFTDFDASKLTGNYRQWEYCVQYGETDFNFVSRLMEHEGIYYYIEHSEGRHKVVLADSHVSHSPIKGFEEVPYYPRQDSMRREKGHPMIGPSHGSSSRPDMR